MKLRIASKFWKGKSYQLLGTKFLLLGILASNSVGSCQSLIVSYQLMGAKFKFVGNNLATEIVLQIPRIGTQMPVSRITDQRLLAGFQSLVLVTEIRSDDYWDSSSWYLVMRTQQLAECFKQLEIKSDTALSQPCTEIGTQVPTYWDLGTNIF